MIENDQTDGPISILVEHAFVKACEAAIRRARETNTMIVVSRDGQIIELTWQEALRELAAAKESAPD